MIERIRTILETKDLTASQFSDQTGIKRAVLSHILSGRNNPSLDVVQKICETFKEISADWLVNGKGEMYSLLSNLQQQNTAVTEAVAAEQNTKQKSTSEKKVIRIVFFYEDNSFSEFLPQ